MFKGADSIEWGYVGGEVTMTCPIQTPNDTRYGKWSWLRYDSKTNKEVIATEANNSGMGPSGTPLNQSRVFGATSQDGSLTLRGLQLNDSGVYKCQLGTGKNTGPRYIKLTVNGKCFLF